MKQSPRERIRILNFALPHNQELPTEFPKSSFVLEISQPVGAKLRFPEIQPRLRHATIPTTWVPVPKTTVHEDRLPTARKNQIRAARQFPPVQPISEAESVGQASHGPLRLGILATDAAHSLASCDGRKCVHESSLLIPVEHKSTESSSQLVGLCHAKTPRLSHDSLFIRFHGPLSSLALISPGPFTLSPWPRPSGTAGISPVARSKTPVSSADRVARNAFSQRPAALAPLVQRPQHARLDCPVWPRIAPPIRDA